MHKTNRWLSALAFAVAGAGLVRSPLSAQMQMLVRPPAVLPFDTVHFTAPRGPFNFTVGDTIAIPLCQGGSGIPVAPRAGHADAGNCGFTNMPAATTNPSGGNPPYHFKLDTMGGFPPFGITLHPDTGFVTGVAKWPGRRTFEVCAVDASENWKCDALTINIQPKPERGGPKPLAGEPLQKAATECGTLTGLVSTLEQTVAEVPDWEKRTRAALDAAREGKVDAQLELFQTAVKGLQTYLEHYDESTRELENAIAQIPYTPRPSPEVDAWRQRIAALKAAREAIERTPKVFTATTVLANQLMGNVADWRAFANFLQDTGFGDDLATKAGALVGGGRSVKMALEGATITRDAILAGIQQQISARDMEGLQRTLNALQSAGSEAANRATEMRDLAGADCLKAIQQAGPQQRLGGPPTTTAPPPKGGGGGGKTAARVIVAAAGLGGGLYALNQAKQIANTTGGGGTGGGSVTATFVSASTINCTSNAGGIVNSCTGTVTIEFSGKVSSGTTYRFQFDAGPGGNRTVSGAGQVQFTISGGSLVCSTLRSGTVIDTSTQVVIAAFTNMPITVSCK